MADFSTNVTGCLKSIAPLVYPVGGLDMIWSAHSITKTPDLHHRTILSVVIFVAGSIASMDNPAMVTNRMDILTLCVTYLRHGATIAPAHGCWSVTDAPVGIPFSPHTVLQVGTDQVLTFGQIDLLALHFPG